MPRDRVKSRESRVKNKKGFTLIELLVVVAIIGTLSVVGVTTYRGVTGGAKDARKKADVNSISKAYEVNYNSSGGGLYQSLQDDDFAGGNVPRPPDGPTRYPCAIGPESYCLINPTITADAYQHVVTCVSLGGTETAPCLAPGDQCYCGSSVQGEPFVAAGGGVYPACDPYGVLASGLVGWWKFNDNAVDAAEKNNSTPANVVYTPDVPANGLNKSATFNGTSAYVSASPLISGGLELENAITVSVWAKFYKPSINKVVIGNNVVSPGGSFSMMVNPDGKPKVSLRLSDNVLYDFGLWNVAVDYLSNPSHPWNLLTFTREANSSVLKVYFNGSYLESKTLPGALNKALNVATNDITIAKDPGNSYFASQMDDLRVYNRALSDLEISSIYNNGEGCI